MALPTINIGFNPTVIPANSNEVALLTEVVFRAFVKRITGIYSSILEQKERQQIVRNRLSLLEQEDKLEKINTPAPGTPEKADSESSSKSLMDILKSFGKVLYTAIKFVISMTGLFVLIKKLFKNPLLTLFKTMRGWFVRILAHIGIVIASRIAMVIKGLGGAKLGKLGKVGLIGIAAAAMAAAMAYGIYELLRRKTELEEEPVLPPTDEDKAMVPAPGTMFGMEPDVTPPPAPEVAPLSGTPMKESLVNIDQLTDVQKMIVKDLKDQGITNPKEVANVLAQIEAESGFKSQNEKLNYTPERLFELYGAGNRFGNKVRFKTILEAKDVIDKGQEAVANVIYGGRMGNLKDDEGFKYRGRGLIQLTGKANYKKYGELIGEDLVSNPELANDPEVASKLAAAYYSNKKSRGTNLADSSSVSRATGGAAGGADIRAISAEKFAAKLTPPSTVIASVEPAPTSTPPSTVTASVEPAQPPSTPPSTVIASAEPTQQDNNVILPQDVQAQIADSGTDEQNNLLVALIYQRHQIFTQVNV